MDDPSPEPAQLQVWIDRLHAGDPAARGELLAHACGHLQRLTRSMLRGYERVKRWEQTDDVLQNALMRLWSALDQVKPSSAREFYGLAALQIRRELMDLARQYFGPQGLGANQVSNVEGDSPAPPGAAQADRADTTQEPSGLAVWSEFHRLVDTLPGPEREVFDLLWYQELTQTEAARLLEISEATLKRRWLSARRRLHQALKGELP